MNIDKAYELIREDVFETIGHEFHKRDFNLTMNDLKSGCLLDGFRLSPSMMGPLSKVIETAAVEVSVQVAKDILHIEYSFQWRYANGMQNGHRFVNIRK